MRRTGRLRPPRPVQALIPFCVLLGSLFGVHADRKNRNALPPKVATALAIRRSRQSRHRMLRDQFLTTDSESSSTDSAVYRDHCLDEVSDGIRDMKKKLFGDEWFEFPEARGGGRQETFLPPSKARRHPHKGEDDDSEYEKQPSSRYFPLPKHDDNTRDQSRRQNQASSPDSTEGSEDAMSKKRSQKDMGILRSRIQRWLRIRRDLENLNEYMATNISTNSSSAAYMANNWTHRHHPGTAFSTPPEDGDIEREDLPDFLNVTRPRLRDIFRPPPKEDKWMFGNETLRLEKELLQAEDEGRIFDAVDRKRTATQHTITP
eukprot:jgi/Bigna1/69084/fgenesh1_pg.8_\